MQYEERQQLTKPSFNSSTQSLPRDSWAKKIFFLYVYMDNLKLLDPYL